ncbi:MAG: translation elongation factor-like protein, partial [Candidatus Aenigmatarchaeota archaeon]
VIELEDVLKVGDKISIEGKTTNFSQIVESMQVEHQDIKEATKGQTIGLKVIERAREGDRVYKIVE